MIGRLRQGLPLFPPYVQQLTRVHRVPPLPKIGRQFTLGRQQIEASLNIFNILNSGYFQQYATGANRQYALADYLRKFNRQPPRAFQISIVDRF